MGTLVRSGRGKVRVMTENIKRFINDYGDDDDDDDTSVLMLWNYKLRWWDTWLISFTFNDNHYYNDGDSINNIMMVMMIL